MRTRRPTSRTGYRFAHQMTRRQLLSALVAGAAGLTGVAGHGAKVWAAAAPQAPAAPVKSYAGTQLRVSVFDQAYPQALKKRLPEFEAKTGMKVDLEILSFPVYNQRAEMELSGGGGANDVMTLVFIQSSKWINAGFATDLNPIIEDAKLTDGASLALEDFSPGALGIFRRGRAIFGLPYFAGGTLMMYRKDILEKNGFAAPPDTIDQFVDVAKKIHSKEVAAYMSWGQSALDWVYANYLFALGGGFLAKPPEDVTPTLNTPQAEKALAVYVDLMRNYAPPGVINFAEGELGTVFPQGKAALWIEDVGRFAPTLDPQRSRVVDKVAFAHVPQGPAGRFPQVGTHAMMIPVGCKRKEAAWEFIKWATGKELMGRIAAEEFHPGVTRISAAEATTHAKQYIYGATNVGKLHGEVLKMAGTGYMAYRVIPEYPQLRDIINVALAQAITGQKSLKDALAGAQAQAVALLESKGYKIRKG